MKNKIEDTFNGDNNQLRECIASLIRLNDSDSLAPHGIGGHAREFLAACYHRLTPTINPGQRLTKPVIEKIIRNNRPGIAAHQIWQSIEKMMPSTGEVR